MGKGNPKYFPTMKIDTNLFTSKNKEMALLIWDVKMKLQRAHFGMQEVAHNDVCILKGNNTPLKKQLFFSYCALLNRISNLSKKLKPLNTAKVACLLVWQYSHN